MRLRGGAPVAAVVEREAHFSGGVYSFSDLIRLHRYTQMYDDELFVLLCRDSW